VDHSEALCSDMSDQLVKYREHHLQPAAQLGCSTEAEAQEFVDQWNSVMRTLWYDGQSRGGCVPVILDGLQGAAVAFSNVEIR